MTMTAGSEIAGNETAASGTSSQGGATRYAERMRRLRIRLAELTDVIYGDVSSDLRGWQLRETIYVTLEALPKRERTAWLNEHGEQLTKATESPEPD